MPLRIGRRVWIERRSPIRAESNAASRAPGRSGGGVARRHASRTKAVQKLPPEGCEARNRRRQTCAELWRLRSVKRGLARNTPLSKVGGSRFIDCRDGACVAFQMRMSVHGLTIATICNAIGGVALRHLRARLHSIPVTIPAPIPAPAIPTPTIPAPTIPACLRRHRRHLRRLRPPSLLRHRHPRRRHPLSASANPATGLAAAVTATSAAAEAPPASTSSPLSPPPPPFTCTPRNADSTAYVLILTCWSPQP